MRNYEGFLRKKAQGRMSRVIFLGAPGAGKGTQARPPAVRVGRAPGGHRRHAARGGGRGTPLGREAKRYMDSGALVPDEVVIGLVGRAPGPARRGRRATSWTGSPHGGPGGRPSTRSWAGEAAGAGTG